MKTSHVVTMRPLLRSVVLAMGLGAAVFLAGVTLAVLDVEWVGLPLAILGWLGAGVTLGGVRLEIGDDGFRASWRGATHFVAWREVKAIRTPGFFAIAGRPTRIEVVLRDGKKVHLGGPPFGLSRASCTKS